MISARALGLLVYITSTNTKPTVSELQRIFPEGREAVRTALKELETHGILIRNNLKMGSRYVKTSEIDGDALLRVSGLLLQRIQLNNHIKLEYILSSKEYLRGAQGEESDMPYDFFESSQSTDDEVLYERQKAMKEKQASYEEQARKKADKKFVSRHSIDQALWTSSDVGYEFSARVEGLWHVKPWSIVSSRFIPALAEMRKRLATDGKIEVKMIDLFFSSLADYSKVDDGNALWKMFMKRAPELAAEARRVLESPALAEQAKEVADKSWEWMDA